MGRREGRGVRGLHHRPLDLPRVTEIDGERDTDDEQHAHDRNHDGDGATLVGGQSIGHSHRNLAVELTVLAPVNTSGTAKVTSAFTVTNTLPVPLMQGYEVELDAEQEPEKAVGAAPAATPNVADPESTETPARASFAARQAAFALVPRSDARRAPSRAAA